MNPNTIQAELVEPQTALVKSEPLNGAVERTTDRPLTSQELRVREVNEVLLPAYQKASTLELSDAEIEAIQAPFPDELVEIRPHDGLIYIPHIHIRNRLSKVFKPGKWAMVCRRHWLEGGTMYGEYVLLIRGCFVGESTGGHAYQPNNPKTNYSDSLESTQGEALRRIAAKCLSCGSQVWEPEYARQWVHKYGAKIAGKWEKKFHPETDLPQDVPEGYKAPSRPSNPAVAPKAQEPAPKEATAKTRERLWAELKALGLDQAGLQYFIESGVLMPNEGMDDVPLHHLPTSQGAFKRLKTAIEAFMRTGNAEQLLPSEAFNVKEKPSTSPELEQAPLAPQPHPDDDDRDPNAVSEPWYGFIIPVPRAGQKRDAYLKQPDTIGGLYEKRHGNDEEAAAARQRLFGFVAHYEPKGWVKRDGTQMPPSESDKRFRDMLDLFVEWFEKYHPGEKI